MSFGQKQQLIQSFVASSDMSAASMQYCFVELNAAGGVNLVDALTDEPVGVLQNTPARGQTAEVCIHGLTKLRVGATDLTGTPKVCSDATGRALALV